MPTTVVENTTAHRFELPLDGGAIAVAGYRVDGDRLVLTHTEVPPEFSGQGIATRLAQGTFDLARASGRKLVLECSFMISFYKHHPDYADIVAR